MIITNPSAFLRDDRTKVIYFGIDGSVWHLSGYGQGREGATLGVEPGMLYMPDMELLYLEGARQDGAKYQDTVLPRREIDFEVQIAGKTNREFMARNDAWWRAWSTRTPGTLAMFTSSTGWRWIKVRLAGNIDTKWGKDPSLIKACDYDMTASADDPLWRTFKDKSHWKNTAATGSGVLQFRNWADHEAYPEYVMPGPGTYSIQDGPDGEMIPLPYIKYGQTLRLDTHPLRLILRMYDSTTGVDGRSFWRGMGTRRFRGSIAPWSDSVIKVAVEGGDVEAQVYGIITPRHLRPF
ncbi:minor tail protein [Gordonia phage Daredevil]|uniref:Minor tail protein n=1 Tax=Gordonia phage Daredevil TaxID=2283286 RepID=A0A345MIN5_9CAUD|nr:minor tail protein [Gordonia phage Daredevil]AXH70416.1 minor tail protein [Gordonia phage Daredevil]